MAALGALVCLFMAVSAGSASAVEVDLLTAPSARIDGALADDGAGRSVANAGDVNGDGQDDLIIGAPAVEAPFIPGAAYVVYGATSLADLDLDSFGVAGFSSAGFRIDAAPADDENGYGVGAAGDVNDDGYDDVVVGARFADPNGTQSGQAFVVYGSATPAHVDLSAIGAAGFQIDGPHLFANAGESVAGAGDVNSDGFDDVIVGASGTSPLASPFSGCAFVIFGSLAPVNVDLSVPFAGFRICGGASGDNVGFSVAGATDVNGDGRDDVIVGAPRTNANGTNSGSAYVVYGSAVPVNVDIGTLTGAGFRIDGAAAGDEAGHSVSSASDVNGDLRDDVIVGSPHAAVNGVDAGAANVVFGSAVPTDVDLAALGGAGIRIEGAAAGDRTGWSVASGDAKGDGFDDVLVGALTADNNGRLDSGSLYVLYGSPTLGDFDLSLSLGAAAGFRIDGAATNDFAGADAATGSVNGLGGTDVVVAAYGANNNARVDSGSVYVWSDVDDPDTVIDSGPSQPATTDTTPAFNFSATDPDPSSGGFSFQCKLDGGIYIPCSSPTSYSPLPDGPHTFYVKAMDNEGNEDPSPAQYTWSIDTVPPTVSITSGPLTPDDDPNATFAWTADDPAPSSGLTEDCKLQKTVGPVEPQATNVFGSCSSPLTYTGLSDGTYTFTVRATDGVAQTATDSRTFVIDTVDPNTVIDAGPAQPWSNDPNPSFTFHETDAAPSGGGFTFQCKLDGGAYGPCTSPQSYTALADGPHAFYVKATDAAGNEDPTPAEYLWSIDTVPPTVSIVFPVEGGRYSTFKDDNLDADYSCADALSGVAFCVGDVADGDPIDNDTLGPHTFTVNAEDLAGNTATDSVDYGVFTFEGLILDDNPLAYYRMGDPMGADTMVDSSGNGNDGQYKNDQDSGPVGISGDGDFARVFTGDAGYGYVNGISAPHRYTLSAFVNFDDTGDQVILQHGGGGALYLEGGTFKFRPIDELGVVLQGQPPVDPVVHTGQWYHVAGVLGVGNKASLYVNGVLRDGPTSLGGKRPSGTSTFYVGFGNLGLAQPWLRGSLDEVAYFDTPLSDTHIFEIFLADPPPAHSSWPNPGLPADGPNDPAPAGPPSDAGSSPDAGPGPSVTPVERKSKPVARTNAQKRTVCLRLARQRKKAAKRMAAVRRCNKAYGKPARAKP